MQEKVLSKDRETEYTHTHIYKTKLIHEPDEILKILCAVSQIL